MGLPGVPVAGDDEERIRYHKDVDTLDADHPWHRIREHVPAGSRVLDVGCGSGELGSFLTHAAEVDGIELDPSRAASARQHLHTVVTGEAGPSADAGLADDYDVIIFADVLEHISYPAPVLEWASGKLAASGTIVALIPNSANWKFRRKILKGDWSYADTGYFDRDHVRFFDIRTARGLGEEAGLSERAMELIPGELPKPIRYWSKARSVSTNIRPNLFAGHVLIDWERRSA